jgi:hypothetical protein
MENEFQMSIMRERTFFTYPSEANDAKYLRASSQVHEGPIEEVQHGETQVRVYSDEHRYVAWSR